MSSYKSYKCRIISEDGVITTKIKKLIVPESAFSYHIIANTSGWTSMLIQKTSNDKDEITLTYMDKIEIYTII